MVEASANEARTPVSCGFFGALSLAASAASFVPATESAGEQNWEHTAGDRKPWQQEDGGTFRLHDARRLMRDTSVEAARERELKDVKAVWVAVGAGVGVLIAIVLAQIDASASPAVQWLIVLPGELFANALLVLALPLAFLNAVTVGVHFAELRKTRQVCVYALVGFAAITLFSSAVGAVVAIAVAGFFPVNITLRTYLSEIASDTANGAEIAFECAGGNATNSSSTLQLVLESNGSLVCSAAASNASSTGSLFFLDNFSHSFQLKNRTDVTSMTEQAARAFEALFPMNVGESLLSTDVMGIMVAGLALGAALSHCAKAIGGRDCGGPRESSLLFLLIVQVEVVLTSIFWWIQQFLLVGVGFMVCGGMLRSSDSAVVPGSDVVLTLFGALFVGLLVEVVSVVGVAVIFLKTSPLRFTREMLPALLVAFCSSSSLAALPSTLRSIETTRQVSKPLAQLVCSTGAALNKSGTAVYLSISSVFLMASASETSLPTGAVVVMILATALCSVVAPPLAGGNCAVLAPVLVAVFGVADSQSAVLIGYLGALNWICDPLVAAVNTLNDMIVAFVLARRLNEKYLDQSYATEDDGTDGSSSAGHQHRTIRELEADERIMSLSLGDSQVAL